MTTFETKVNKFRNKIVTAEKYVYGLNTPKLTKGFWNNFGYELTQILDDLKNNHQAQWIKYCEQYDWSNDTTVEDFFC